MGGGVRGLEQGCWGALWLSEAPLQKSLLCCSFAFILVIRGVVGMNGVIV